MTTKKWKQSTPARLITTATVLAIIGVVLVVSHHASPRRDSHPLPVPVTPQHTPSVSTAPSAAPSDLGGAEPDQSRARKAFDDQAIQRGLEATRPRNLPPQQEKDLVALAWQIVRADVTGQGRQHWPAYFTGPPARGQFTQIRLRAGVAHGTSDTVDVLLIWSGRDPHQDDNDHRRTFLRLTWDGTRWQPMNPADGT